jgi:hypothetical protein
LAAALGAAFLAAGLAAAFSLLLWSGFFRCWFSGYFFAAGLAAALATTFSLLV